MAMKVASHHWMRMVDPLERVFARLSECGYDAIELSGMPHEPGYSVPEVRNLMQKYKLEIWGAVTLMFQGRDLVSHDPQIRANGLKYCIDILDWLKQLGGQEITIVPGEVGRIKSVADRDDEWKWGVEAMRKISAHAKELKIRIAIEPLNRFETNFINNHKQALLLAQEAGGDHVGVCLDAFHINIEEDDPVAAIKAVGKKLYDFHVADTNRRPPGQGNHDWDAILGAIAKTGYEGCLTNEFVIPADRTPLNPVKDDPEGLRGMTPEQIKFYVDHAMAPLTDVDYTKQVRATGDFLNKWLKAHGLKGGKAPAAAKPKAKGKAKAGARR
jgi:sugar phosphate isomerase/epimerase